MNGMDKKDDCLQSSAVSLIQRAWERYDKDYTAGCMTCAVYDTAWISMVSKNTSDGKIWLFPESFEYLLSTQSEDGGWKADCTSSQVDGILNTAASLLSLHRHRLEPLNTNRHALDDVERRINRATASLAGQLAEWDVAATEHVGFEIIVPTLLDLLKAENLLLDFQFNGEKILRQLNRTKMSKFEPGMLYSRKPSTAIHSLEAFIGKVDFDKLSHHKSNGSMMGSPSSTAAYLIHTSQWDDEAEAYLRHVVAAGAGEGSGAVPSAFPSAFFEYSWMLSSMMSAGFSVSDLGCAATEELVSMLSHALATNKGLLGFAPGLPPDADDTAQCIICLRRFGRSASPDAMIKAFESPTHFRTYFSERNPSFTANCNILSALLSQADASQYWDQILKIVKFICDYWWNNDGRIKDKWNLSHHYASLLAVQSIMELLVQIDKGTLKPLSNEMQSKVNITLFQICFRALLDKPSPSSIEVAAYRILVLCKARRIPIFRFVKDQIDDEIASQVEILRQSGEAEINSVDNHVWIEKVSFGSPLLTQGYRLAALKAASSCTDEVPLGSLGLTAPRLESGLIHMKLLRKTPLFERVPNWQLQASALEASLFQPLLRNRRLDVFPRENMAPDKYFDLIPLTWISCNNRTKTFASNRFIFEMMIISFLDFQADEFMEAVAGPAYEGRTDELNQLIEDICDNISGGNPSHDPPNKRRKISENGSSSTPGVKSNGTNGCGTRGLEDLARKSNGRRTQLEREEVRNVLSRFVSHIYHHPSVHSASGWDRASTLRELRVYLRAHVTQSVDNARLVLARKKAQQQDGTSTAKTTECHNSSTDSYFRWVRTTSADHTACTYSFAFAGCLLSAQSNGAETFPTTKTKYLAAATCQHLATMCRMYNDYGSVARDEAESNLNSVDFSEFGSDNISANVAPQQVAEEKRCNEIFMQTKKDILFELAQYERSWLNDALGRLKAEMQGSQNRRQLDTWQMFCDVTDLYGQIYLVKDIASRMKVG